MLCVCMCVDVILLKKNCGWAFKCSLQQGGLRCGPYLEDTNIRLGADNLEDNEGHL